MAHPFQSVRQSKVEHSRVGALTKGYADGGTVLAPATAAPKKAGGPVKGVMRMDGGGVKARADKVNRARGGRTKGGKGHTVNVIVAPSGNKPPMPMPVPTPPPMAARPPMAPPPGMGPPGAGPMPPPGMPPVMRAKGGKVNSTAKQMPFKQSVAPDLNLSSNERSKKSEADKVGAGKGRTMMSHDHGKNDGPNIGRKAVITKATGGSISSSGAKMAPHAMGGAGGAKSRLDKANHPGKYEC